MFRIDGTIELCKEVFIRGLNCAIIYFYLPGLERKLPPMLTILRTCKTENLDDLASCQTIRIERPSHVAIRMNVYNKSRTQCDPRQWKYIIIYILWKNIHRYVQITGFRTDNIFSSFAPISESIVPVKN